MGLTTPVVLQLAVTPFLAELLLALTNEVRVVEIPFFGTAATNHVGGVDGLQAVFRAILFVTGRLSCSDRVVFLLLNQGRDELLADLELLLLGHLAEALQGVL